MKRACILLLVLGLMFTGCGNAAKQDAQKEPYIIHTKGGDIEIEGTHELRTYAEILAKNTEEGACYAFVRVAGSEEQVFLVSDHYFILNTEGGREDYVTSRAAAYMLEENGNVCFLGELQSEMASFTINIDQLGYLYSAETDKVTCWAIDAEKNKLVAKEGAYRESKAGELSFKYFNEETGGEIEEMHSESAIQSMHRKNGGASSIRFIPLIWYD